MMVWLLCIYDLDYELNLSSLWNWAVSCRKVLLGWVFQRPLPPSALTMAKQSVKNINDAVGKQRSLNRNLMLLFEGGPWE